MKSQHKSWKRENLFLGTNILSYCSFNVCTFQFWIDMYYIVQMNEHEIFLQCLINVMYATHNEYT